MEPSTGFDIVGLLQGLLSLENIVNFAPVVVVAGIISAFINTKSSHPNPIIRAADQLLRDVLNALALNIVKAKNKDDDR